MSLRPCLALALAAVLVVPVSAAEKKRGLDIYWIDTEGGAATLLVTPAGESVLIVTHWHLDHYGGVGRLHQLIPIRHFHDRGIPETLAEDRTNFPTLIAAYKSASRGKSTTLKPGMEVPLKQAADSPPVRLLCVCASGEVLPERKGAPRNPLAKEHRPQPIDRSDNARSVGFVLSFGDWRFLDLGDLTWNVEYRLVAPTDRIGPVDVYQVTHHGLEVSNNPVLIRTVNPRVAVCNNGPRKGGHPSVLGTLRRLPEIEGIYQLHRNLKATDAENTDPHRIANDGRKKEAGAGIHLSVAADARTYTVTVGKRTFTHRTRGKPQDR